MSITRTAHRLAALVPVLALWACAAPQGGDDGYKVVQQDITYNPNDKGDKEWRALMVAMDRCHQGGFSDAQPATAPQTRCLENGADGCARFAAHLSWDCIGLGYQTD